MEGSWLPPGRSWSRTARTDCRPGSRRGRRCTARRRSAATRLAGTARRPSAQTPTRGSRPTRGWRSHQPPAGEVGDDVSHRGSDHAAAHDAQAAEEHACGKVERQRADAVKRHVHGREQQGGRDQGAAVAAPRPDGVEERSAECDLLRGCHDGHHRCPKGETRVERGNLDSGAAMRGEPRPDERAPAGHTQDQGSDPQPSRAPARGARHRKERRREYEGGRHRRGRVRSAHPGAEGRGGHYPDQAQHRWSRRSRADPPRAALGCNRPRRRGNYLAGPGAARAGATSARSGRSPQAALRSGSIAATATVAVSSEGVSKPPGAKRSHTTTATTWSSWTTGRSSLEAVSMLDRRWARYDAASVRRTGRRWAMTWASKPSGRP